MACFKVLYGNLLAGTEKDRGARQSSDTLTIDLRYPLDSDMQCLSCKMFQYEVTDFRGECRAPSSFVPMTILFGKDQVRSFYLKGTCRLTF